MIKNYFKIALRNLEKNLGYSIINLFGLSAGLASFLLITIWVINEISYDKYHKNSDRLYRASMEFASGGFTIKSSVSPTALLPALQEIPEVENAVRLYRPGNFSPPIVKVNQESFKEKNLYYADSTLFDVFTFTIIKGTARVLNLPTHAAVSETIAKKYFGEEDPIGKFLEVNGLIYTVSAVYQDMPPNSHFHADLFLPFSSHRASKIIQWGSANYATYFVLRAGASITNLNDRLNNKIEEDLGGQMTAENYMKANVIPVKDIHLFSNADSEIEPQGSIIYVYIFTSIALLVLLIACINYMNLASAKAAERAREVGVRKVMGAFKTQLFRQFMLESYIMTLTAGILSLVLVQVLMPVFSDVAGFTYSLSSLFNSYFIFGFFLIILFVAFAAGSYPALILSSFKPQQVLKGTFSHSEKGAFLRKFLVVVQFVITVVLITGTLIIFDQLNFVRNKALGYDKDQVLELPYNSTIAKRFENIRNTIKQQPGMVEVARGSDSPVATGGGYSIRIPSYGDDFTMMVTGLAADENYLDVMGIEIKSGRKFTENDWKLLQDTIYSFIINESAQEALLATDEEILGMEINLNGRRGTIVGVVKNFHFSGLQNKIEPMVIFLEEQYNDMFVRLTTDDDVYANLNNLASIWKSSVPEVPFDYSFLNEHYQELYQAEVRLGRLFSTFAVLAIFIACLGLFGLVSFLALQKTKEIGVRKILGASVGQLVFYLTKDFARLIFIAFIISVPLAYYLMNTWLENFAYKINLTALPFLVAAVIALIIGLLTVSYQSFKAATADPVKALRSE